MVSKVSFYLVSIVIAVILIFGVFRSIGKFFLKKGVLSVEGKSVIIEKSNGKKITIAAETIESVSIDSFKLYRANIDTLTIQYKHHKLKFYQDKDKARNVENEADFKQIKEMIEAVVKKSKTDESRKEH